MTLPGVLERSRALVDPALRSTIGRLQSGLRSLAEYHFGWTEIDGSTSQIASGKGLRPALAVLSAEAVGGTGKEAVPGAVAVELVHNFSLMHDDIIDADKERRHRASVWSAFGIDEAVISGDALHNLAYQVLLEEPSQSRLFAAKRLSEATAAMIAGQAADMAFDDQPIVSLNECVAMEAGKTGALLAYSASVGAVLAGANLTQIVGLEKFGLELGCAFQAVDDVLGIWGDAERTGKPVGNDLRERKKSLPVVAALEMGGRTADELLTIYGKVGDLTDSDVLRAKAVLEDAGGREHAEAFAKGRLVVAIDALEDLGLEQSAVDEFKDLARFMVERDF